MSSLTQIPQFLGAHTDLTLSFCISEWEISQNFSTPLLQGITQIQRDSTKQLFVRFVNFVVKKLPQISTNFHK